MNGSLLTNTVEKHLAYADNFITLTLTLQVSNNTKHNSILYTPLSLDKGIPQVRHSRPC